MFVIAFVVAFGILCGLIGSAPQAFAGEPAPAAAADDTATQESEGADLPQESENDPVDTGANTGGAEEEPPAVPDGIAHLAIYYLNTAVCVGETNSPNLQESTIREKGGKIDFYTVSGWDDWSDTTDDWRVQWESSDETVARVYGGTVEAVSDGVAQITAFVPAEDNPNGMRVEAVCTIVVVGQGDSAYVTRIRLADNDGNAIPEGEPYIITGDISVEQRTFYALVDIYDVSTDTTTTYSTKDGALSAQIEGMGDVQYYVGDPAMSSVDSDQNPGLWRPVVYGISTLYAYVNAGIGNERVSTNTTIAMRDPEGGLLDDEYHPQDSLTVLCYYELYQPQNMWNKDDPRFVTNMTFSLAELEALGTGMTP